VTGPLAFSTAALSARSSVGPSILATREMTVVAPIYTTCWGMLKQPDNPKTLEDLSRGQAAVLFTLAVGVEAILGHAVAR
jgi:hypothetical protein